MDEMSQWQRRRRGRPMVPIVLTGDERQTLEQVITRRWRSSRPTPPNGRRGPLARATRMSQTAVSRIWRAFAFKPHLVDLEVVVGRPQFIDKVRDIVGLYLTRLRRRWCCAWTSSPRSRPGAPHLNPAADAWQAPAMSAGRSGYGIQPARSTTQFARLDHGGRLVFRLEEIA
jgi:hypothetical protein